MIRESGLDLPHRDIDADYAFTLVNGLAEEARACARERPELMSPAAAIMLEAETILAGLNDEQRTQPWETQGRAQYGALCKRLAALLSEHETIARSYDDMQAFWEDARKQSIGDSPYTFWDVYEHGSRRRLERSLAASYEVEDAILVNSGMSAIAVAAQAARVNVGDIVHVSARGYFETADLFDRLISTRGATVTDVIGRNGELACIPSFALLEVADATPGPYVQLDEALGRLVTAGCSIVIDNSLFGAASNWSHLVSISDQVVVVESLAKFIGRELMGGVIYGSSRALTPLRLLARGTGQQLQAHAFHRLRLGEVAGQAQRLALHARNAAVFLNALEQSRAWLETCSPLRPNFQQLEMASGGCLVFLRVRASQQSRAQMHRRILARWRQLATANGHNLPVRAGYGWDETSARCYEGDSLKQVGVEDYMRISLGVEGAGRIVQLGDLLNKSIEEICHDQ